jgi:hypothetical protein
LGYVSPHVYAMTKGVGFFVCSGYRYLTMSKYWILLIAVALAAVMMAGCTSAPSTPFTPDTTITYPPSTQGVGQPVPVSINATPVQYAEVNGVRLGYREYGSGEPLLMINGFDSTIDTMWNQTFIDILATKYHVYIWDYPGMGYSSDDNATPTISRYSDYAAGLMTVLGYSSMNVYGASMGSSVSQQLVIDHPERVRKLILESVTYSIRIPECKVLFAVINSTWNNSSEPDGLRKEAEANLAWNGTWTDLAGINKNVMLAVGTADILTPQNVTVQIAGQIDGSWLVRFKDLPHIGSRYAPVQYGKNTLDFLGMNESPPY